MINLHDYENELKYVLDTIKSIFDMDYAIFDVESNLVISTESYVKIKGMVVHAPSIQEVIMKGTITVNNPGYMKACLGCRFKDNCPSTIEILKSIKINTESLGVLAFTSFSKEGHDKIVNDIEFYTNIVDHFANLLSVFIMQKYKGFDSSTSKASLATVLDLSDDGFITTDANGNIEVINTSALEFFSSCGMYTKSIKQLFPDNIVSIILSGRSISNYRVKINDLFIKIFSTPVRNKEVITGAAIRIIHNKLLLSDNLLINNNELPYSLDSIKGKSNHVKIIKNTITKISSSPSTVFISGETGTGKGLLAKTLHYESKRRNKPFVTINCTSIPESLFESELFGYESGAFTGAKKEGKPGKFELANEGTLFLDEISEIPINIQAKLLSVLQDSTFERVGGIIPINIDVRIIAASNRNLEEMIEKKEFRSDLFYRLNVIPIKLIPLRDRRDDIKILANDFLQYYNKKLKRQILGFDNTVSDIFNKSGWPGNIRQLENVIEYCVNMANNDVITSDDLPLDFLHSYNNNIVENSKLKDSEYKIIIETVDKYGWDTKGKTIAAKELGMGLRTLYRKLNAVNN